MTEFTEFSGKKPKDSSGITAGTKAQYDRIYFAKVADNADVQRMGRLRVYIPELGGDPLNDNTWITVAYCSPFAGATNPWPEMGQELYEQNQSGRSDSLKRRKGNIKDQNTFEGTQQSYGFWMIPPDLNNEVVVGFANGDPTKGFWFGCIYQQYMNHMVPGVAANHSHQGDGDIPVSEYNRLVTDSSVSDPAIRPEHRPLHAGLKLQGLLRDTLRGISSSSARREAPSEVYGVLTPRGSHFVMDDNEENELIRLRTRSGAQILISETHGHIYMISRDGRTWLELNNDGYVDVYGLGSISFHTGQDINFHADQQINLHAGGNVNIKADRHFATHADGDVDILSYGSIRQSSGGDTQISAGGVYNESAEKIMMNMEGSATARSVQMFAQDGNRTVRSSAATRVPEAEPWSEHEVLDGPTPIADPIAYRGNVFVEEAKAKGVTADEAENEAKEKLQEAGPPPGACVDNATLTTSEGGILLLLQSEAFVPFQYWDQKGYSIGYGHFIGQGDFSAEGLTEEEAFALFTQTVKKFESGVKSAVTACLTQAQFDALVSFSYNLGPAIIQKSKDLQRYLNEQRHREVYLQMKKFVYSNGSVSKGLIKRREKEANLYLTGQYPNTISRAYHRAAGIAFCMSYPNVGQRWGRAKPIQNVQAKNAYRRMTGKNLS